MPAELSYTCQYGHFMVQTSCQTKLKSSCIQTHSELLTTDGDAEGVKRLDGGGGRGGGGGM